MFFKGLSILIGLASLTLYVSGQPLINRFDSLCRAQQHSDSIPGLVVGIIANGQVIFQKGYGSQDLKSLKPVTVQTDFHLASVSKPFVATAIMQLAEAGQVALDSPLVRYIPHWAMADKRYLHITLRQVLTHTSGIPDVTDYQWKHPQNDAQAVERYVQTFTRQSLDFAPGAKFSYSNAAFDLLAAVIHHVTGLTFETYMKQHIFAPLHMAQSSYRLSDIDPSRRASPHIRDSGGAIIVSAIYPYNRIHAPSSTLHSNLRDMLQWAGAWVDSVHTDAGQLISHLNYGEMLRPQVGAWEDSRVCLSWFTSTIDGHQVYFHAGSDLGFRSFVGFDPKEKIAVVLMGNNNLFDSNALGFSLMQAALNN